MSTSFVQFRYCDICRINHSAGHKHVFTNKHKRCLETLLSKFAKKVSIAKKEFKRPVIEDETWEDGAKFWCYFCAQEVEKHMKTEQAETIKNAGFIKHLASEDHSKNMDKYWKNNRLDNARKSKFIFTQKHVENFLAEAKKTSRVFQNERIGKHQQVVQKICYQEHVRERLQMYQPQHQMPQSIDLSQLPLVTDGRSGTNDVTMATKMAGMRTVGATGPGLTCVKIKGYDGSIGNVHTGAAPPWMQKDDVASDLQTEASIGPTLEDYQKHLERERKKKLPATRVGAKFEHDKVTGVNWLPSFGRVWSANRRSHDRNQFMKGHRRNPAPAAISRADQLQPDATGSNWLEPESAAGRNEFTPAGYGPESTRPYHRKRDSSSVELADTGQNWSQPVSMGYHMENSTGANGLVRQNWSTEVSTAAQNWTPPVMDNSTAKKTAPFVHGKFHTGVENFHRQDPCASTFHACSPKDVIQMNGQNQSGYQSNESGHFQGYRRNRSKAETQSEFSPIHIADNLL